MRKKRVLIHSNYLMAPTGFGSYARNLLTGLFKLDKYELFHYAAGKPWADKDFERFPFPVYGTLPQDAPTIARLNQDPNLGRMASYGGVLIDRVIKEVKPDVYISIEDFWANSSFGAPWWNKMSCVVHWTADSLPLLPDALKNAPNIQHHYVWAEFAKKEFHRLAAELEKKLPSATEEARKELEKNIAAYKRVDVIPGMLDEKVFYRMGDGKRRELREKFGIDEDTFCVAWASRNQLRKLISPVIDGFKKFKNDNPKVKTKLLLYLSLDEGWDVIRLCEQHGVNPEDVLVAYRCRKTGQIFIWPAQRGELDNPNIPEKKSITSIGLGNFAGQDVINEWLNLADTFILPLTSSGFELWVYQAKLAELITITNDYAATEDVCVPEAKSVTLKWNAYTEIGTQFIKATVSSSEVCKALNKVYRMDRNKKREMEKAARQWVVERFTLDKVIKQWETLIDSLPLSEYSFENTQSHADADAVVEDAPSNEEWIERLYRRILGREPDGGGKAYWMQQLNNNAPRPSVEDYFRKVARDELNKSDTDQLENTLGKEPAEDRVLIAMPESLGDCLYLTCLLKDARELYHDKKIYVTTKPAFMDVFKPLVGTYIDYVIPWCPEFDNSYALEGACGHKKYFQVMLNPHFPTQRMISYLHNAEDRSNIDLNYASLTDV